MSIVPIEWKRASKPAARNGDQTACPLVEPGPTPHVGGALSHDGAGTIAIEGKAAITVGDTAACKVGPPDSVKKGSGSVFFYGKPAARRTDAMVHGGFVATAASTVFIGDGDGKSAADDGCFGGASQSGAATVSF